MKNSAQIWQDVCSQLRTLLNEDTYNRWIAGIVPLDITKDGCRLGVSNEMFSDWLSMNYRGLISKTLEDVAGFQAEVRFESGHEAIVPAPAESAPSSSGEKKGRGAIARLFSHDAKQFEGFNRRFTFDTFVVGDNNRFAHAAASAVARSPGKAYNPLFIHSPTGLGKTHILQAIAQDILGRRKRARIEYLSSEEFLNSYINALSANTIARFRKHYRSLDVLLIDDVHFFAGKDSSQEEFFHTFNALYNAHKQIILASDRPPHEIGGLEKRLVSRFEWGLTTDIQPPDLETRIAILKRKQQDHEEKLSDELLFYIASRVKSNIRRLEGALVRLVSYASVTGSPVNKELTDQLLRPVFDEESASLVTVEQIQRTVAEHYDIRLADMTSKRRPQNIAFPRQVAMYLCRRLTNFSSPTIGERFNRNHATILHAETLVTRKISDSPDLRHEVSLLERKIKG